jgi:hypothetical protein
LPFSLILLKYYCPHSEMDWRRLITLVNLTGKSYIHAPWSMDETTHLFYGRFCRLLHLNCEVLLYFLKTSHTYLLALTFTYIFTYIHSVIFTSAYTLIMHSPSLIFIFSSNHTLQPPYPNRHPIDLFSKQKLYSIIKTVTKICNIFRYLQSARKFFLKRYNKKLRV